MFLPEQSSLLAAYKCGHIVDKYDGGRCIVSYAFCNQPFMEKPLNFDPFGHAELSLFAKI